MNKRVIYFLPILLTVSFTVINASPGIHLQVPNSPLTIGQPVYIEYSSDAGEQGTIIITIISPGGGSILWSSGQMQCSPGIVQSVTVTGITNVAGTYTVGAELWLTAGGMISGQTTFQVIGTSPFDFTIQLTPPSITLEAGDSGNLKVSLTYSDPSYAGTVITIQVTGLGPGMNYQLSTFGDLKVTTSPTTPPGTYPITVTGSAQGRTHQTSGTIIVTTKTQPTTQTVTTTYTTPTQTPQPTGDYTLQASPLDTSIFQGETATFSLTVDKTGEFNDAVVFTGVNGHPADTSPELQPEEGTPRFTATLKLETHETTQPGTYMILVETSGGGKTHSVTLALTIKEKQESASSTTTAETGQTGTGESNALAPLSTPTTLMIVILAVVIILLAAVLYRRRSPPPQRQHAPTQYCPNCGEPLTPGKAFCGSCGEKVEE